MGLPESYLSYPHRRYGMDHDRYEWSMLPARPPVQWPGAASVALWVTVALEFFPLNPPAEPFLAPGSMVTPYPDLRHYSLRDYGNRVGVFRVMKVLDELGIAASVAMSSKVAQRYPRLVEEVDRRGWEIVANGLDMGKLHHSGLSREREEEMVEEALSVLRSSTGQPVVGWSSPARSESAVTLDLVAARGVRYVCDWANDDMPYAMHTETGTIHSMPQSHDLDDQAIIVGYHQPEQELVNQVGDAFATLLDESSRQGGRILSVVIHPWVSGQPHRIRALRDALADIATHGDVWSAPGGAILDAFLAGAEKGPQPARGSTPH